MKSTVTFANKPVTEPVYPVAKIWKDDDDDGRKLVVLFFDLTSGIALSESKTPGIVTTWFPATDSQWEDFNGTVSLEFENGH